MLRYALICTVSLVALVASAVHADPKDDVKAAVQKLTDSASYSWSTTVEGSSRPPTTGKTEKDGFTFVSLPVRDNTFNILIKGDKAAIKTADGWKSTDELIAANTPDSPPSPESFVARIASSFKTPGQQALDNVDKLQNVQKTDDGYTGDLSPEAAKDLMLFRPRPSTNPSNAPPQMDVSDAKCSFKLWVTDGSLSKMEIHVSGTITFNGNDRNVDRTSTTDITDVGTTSITSADAPDDAKAKLQ
jgi:hypothetical protein